MDRVPRFLVRLRLSPIFAATAIGPRYVAPTNVEMTARETIVASSGAKSSERKTIEPA